MKRYKTFYEMLGAASPGSAALVFEKDGQKATLTYGELLDRMKRYPLPPEGAVGVFADLSPETVLAILSLAGKRRLVLLNPADPPETLALQIAKTGVQRLEGACPEEFSLTLPAAKKVQDSDILFFTSGTTGTGKAVVLDEGRLCSAAYNGGSLLPLRREDLLLSVLPCSHVFGFVCALLWPLSFGATVALGRGIRRLFEDFSFFRPTVSCLVPEMAEFLASRRLFNPELSLLLLGAGVCRDETLAVVRSLGIRLSYGYGLTETSSGIALSLGDDPRAMTVCPDYTVRLEEDGEIVVSSETTLMKGYFGDREGTDAVLRGNELHTGDLGRIDKGKLYITGRKKEILVFSDGTKIFLPEYEKRLQTALGGQAELAVAKDRKGRLTLFLAKSKDAKEKVDAFNREQPRSHRIERIRYLPALPKTAAGKVQRYKLIEEEDEQ